MVLKRLFGILSKQDNEIGKITKETGFDVEVINIVKEVALHKQLQTYILDHNDQQTVGLFFLTYKEDAEYEVLGLQSELEHLGYLSYMSDSENDDNRKINILKGTDQFEILKLLQTNGDNHDISNSDVIARLKQWHNHYPFSII
ncbi:hypothetical protein [Metabacillus malikii]|uniref:Uncharacterized protein n=1 Tax=Metabacillus malikii TaxID=1504265 RepID=A0ABT9ZCY0_9BACI|nr:hypothetical protein [Metabacillus malikii]